MTSRLERAGRMPDFFIAGVPKAGTTALHYALAAHPQLLMSAVKEPKYFLCDGRPPARQHGPGDAHSAREWIWERGRYEALFAGSDDRLRGESTPFYLYDLAAQHRIATALPEARFVVVVRDPVDRAYSNWLHLWSDGLEPISSFEDACRAEEFRLASGWAPFWHYQRTGRYGEQLENLFGLFPKGHVLLLRYRQVVDAPGETLDRICTFLGVETGRVGVLGAENSRGFVVDSTRNRILARVVRAGARAGALLPPQVWRKASTGLIRALQTGASARPPLPPDVRRRLVEQFRDDVALLEKVTGESFSDWLGDTGRGAFAERSPADRVSEGAGPG